MENKNVDLANFLEKLNSNLTSISKNLEQINIQLKREEQRRNIIGGLKRYNSTTFCDNHTTEELHSILMDKIHDLTPYAMNEKYKCDNINVLRKRYQLSDSS